MNGFGVRFEDGSSLSLDPETDEIIVAGSTATLLLAAARRTLGRPPEEALASLRAAVPAGASISDADSRRTLAVAYVPALRQESLWLFRRDPIAPVAGPGDRSLGEALEVRVKAFDEALRAGTLDDPTESARRQILLAQVRAAGLLGDPLLAQKRDALDDLALVHLASLSTAAHALAAYYASPQRAKILRSAAPADVTQGPLSLDWTSSAEPPPGVALHAWWAFCEESLGGAADTGQPRGRFVVAQGRLIAQLLWRVEDGTRRALYSASYRLR
jgi:hypothetical protein